MPLEEGSGSACASLCLQGMVLGFFGRVVDVCARLCVPASVSHPRA